MIKDTTMFVRERVFATATIWGVMTGVIAVISSAGSAIPEHDLLPIISILSFAAVLCTRFVWNAKFDMGASANVVQMQSSGKAKRTEGGRVGRLLDALDVDEIEELRSRLEIEDDTEATTFDELLSQYKG
jgi:hypothetical protein